MERDLESESGPRRTSLSAAALGVLGGAGALASSSCCVLPLALAMAGAGGAWLGDLGVLTPYRAPILAAAALILAAAWLAYFYFRRRRGATGCARDGIACATRRSAPTIILLAIATKLTALAAIIGWYEGDVMRWLLELQG